MRSAGARLRATLGSMALLLLAACGGGGGGGDDTSASCDVASQNQWLRGYMNDNYFWYASSPNPDPAGYATVDAYFNALLYTGYVPGPPPSGDPAFPQADRWSYFQPTENFERQFGDGESLGYGVSVAGLEVQGQPSQPLYVRYVEPRSPAAGAGVVRGDRILSMNGRSSADIITADDFSALTATAVGQTLTLVLRNTAGADRTVTLSSAVFALTPVTNAALFSTPGGRLMGYVVVKDMLSQALAPMDDAFAMFRANGVQEVVLDLRYNGGGLVSVAGTLASLVAGNRNNAAGQPFATLLYNDRQAARSNQTFRFDSPTLVNSLGVTRVYVLAGARTCSASEQVVNGLRPYVSVVLVGDTTCGKPVGFLPASNCGTTYSAVNFETVNAANEGRYFDGFNPSSTCTVAEDFTVPLGAVNEALLVAAASHVDSGSCGGTGVREQPLALKLKSQGRRITEPGERPAMIPR
jgi:carboxyl-terminal processing protease